MYQEFVDYILKTDKISIFRHIHPDGDAVGSQLALYQWIKDNLPEKEVHVMGHDSFNIYPFLEEVGDSFVADSCAIILDTSTSERVDDQRFRMAKSILRVDHHPLVERFENILIVEPQRSSTCELLTEIFKKEETEKNDLYVSETCARYLYSGILTDTLNFRTTNTGKRTLEMAAYLAGKGISIPDISTKMFELRRDEFLFRGKLRSYSKLEEGLCSIILDTEDLRNLQVDALTAKNAVAELGDVKEHEIWAIFVYDQETELYNGSLRCKKEYIVNDIASHYHGGGHPQAAGIRGLTKADVEAIKKELIHEIKIKKK